MVCNYLLIFFFQISFIQNNIPGEFLTVRLFLKFFFSITAIFGRSIAMMRYTSGDFREIPMTVKTYDNIITSNSTEFPTRRRKNNNNNGYCVKNLFGSYDYNTKL